MTTPAGAVVGSMRVIVLAPDTTAVRGTMAEFRHFGVSLVVKTDILAALTELVHDPMAVIVVSSEIPCQDTADVLDLAVATCRSAVLFGLHPSTPTAAVSRALTAGVRGVIELPVTPERLTHTLRSVPTAPSNAPGEVSVGDLRIDVGRHLVQLRDAVVPTTPREFDVLLALATSYPGMVSLSELADRHGSGADPYASVRVVIARLRTRFAQLAGVPRESVIATQRGIGYRLAA